MASCICRQRVLSGHLDGCSEGTPRPAEVDFQQVPRRSRSGEVVWTVFVFRGAEHATVHGGRPSRTVCTSPRERDEVVRALRNRGALPVGSGLLNTEQSFDRRLTFDVREGRRR